MIFVDRNRVSPPPSLLDYHRREIERLRPIFESLQGAHSQKVIDLRMPRALLDQVREKLFELFKGRCAFCERSGSEVEHFRPLRRAARLDGSIDPEHYWWLASDWGNLYLSCPRCNMSKRNLFPILGEVAAPMSDRQSLLCELPLLIDPCLDNPQDHLKFLSNGQVVALTDRGAATIKIFQLNQRGLIATRSELAVETLTVAQELMSLGSQASHDETRIRGFFSSNMSFFAVRQAALDELFTEVSTPPVTPAAPPVEVPEAIKAIPDAIWLETIEIQNFKVISDLKLSFPPLQRDGEHAVQPWLMVLGENGVGKSSLLQAVALTMMPASERDKTDASSWLRKGKSISNGFVRLLFSDGNQREMVLEKGKKTFHITGDAPDLPVLAYSSTRLLPDDSTAAPASPDTISVRNLFDHIYPLAHVERYLCDKKKISDTQFNLLATSLKELLPVNADALLTRKSKHMESKIDDRSVSLRELSDGYKSVLALAMDIMFHLTNSSFDMESAQGVVMIDELELHLHPRWKIQIVERLRQLFPRVRFIASTHDPLCVHGLKSGELWVMAKHPKDQSFLLEQIDVPPGSRADEVLTGPWFGLESTIDTETLLLMSEHSELLQQARPNAERLAELEARLRQRMVTFGSTRAQRAAMAAAAVLDVGMPESQANQLIKHRLQNILEGKSGKRQEHSDA
ncbi:AAA family ATPase [Pseudomonas sp. NPDC087803]|uniref:AAA family ATPase n=1 Tax=Pseudomonas sp. NPDC087803 TaxID=3364448 RepID=UPI003800D5A8